MLNWQREMFRRGRNVGGGEGKEGRKEEENKRARRQPLGKPCMRISPLQPDASLLWAALGTKQTRRHHDCTNTAGAPVI